MTARTLAAATLAAAVAGCGPPAAEERPTHFDLAPTRACLRTGDDVRVTTQGLDFVATTALGGGLRVTFPNNFVVLAFGETAQEAVRIERAYIRFAGEDIPVEDVVRRDQNVVMVWNAPPSAEDDARIRDCLSAAD